MLKELVQGVVIATGLCCATASGATADDDSAQASDDAHYCRFQREGVRGDIEHVEEFTEVKASVCQSGEQYVYCFFDWRPDVGVVVAFWRETGNASEMRTLGFWPSEDCPDAP